MTDREILIWIHQRLVSVHKENELYDYMHMLREVIHRTPKDRRGGSLVTMTSDKILKEIREQG